MKKFLLLSVALLAGSVLVIGADLPEAKQGLERAGKPAKPPEHGTEFIIRIELEKATGATNLMESLEASLRKRFRQLNQDIYWQKLSESQIRIVTPMTDPAEVKSASASAFRDAQLEFRLVHQDSITLVGDRETPSGYEVLRMSAETGDGKTVSISNLVKKVPESGLTGKYVTRAMVGRDHIGRLEIEVEFNSEGAKIFEQITTANVGNQIAIVIGGKLQTAPTIREPISGGQCTISGNFTRQEAESIAGALSSPLPVPVKLISTKSY